MVKFDQKILTLLDVYKTAVEVKDVDQFLSIYDPEVVIFDMWGNWEYHGRDAWRKNVQEWFGSLGTDTVKVEINDIQVVSDQRIAGLYAFFTFKGFSETGDLLRSMDNRFSMVLRSQNGEWKILHEHSSGPIDPETTKVNFKRE